MNLGMDTIVGFLFLAAKKNQKGRMGGVGWEGSFSICLAFGTFSPLVLRLPRYLPALHYGVYLRSLPVPVEALFPHCIMEMAK